MDFAATKRSFAQKTRLGIPFIWAGVLAWVLFGTLGTILPENIKQFVYLFGAGTQFPLGILVAKLMGIDPFDNTNPLSKLVGFAGGLQIFFAPVVIFLWKTAPQAVPWCLAVLVAAHFLPFVWLFDSNAYLFATIGMAVVGVAVALFLPALAYTASGFGVAAVLLVTVLLLYKDERKLKEALRP